MDTQFSFRHPETAMTKGCCDVPSPIQGFGDMKARGFTLIELLIIIIVIGIMATIAIPSFQNMLRTNAVVSQNNETVALIQYARSEAIRSGIPVTVTIENPGDPNWVAGVANLRQTSNERVLLDGPGSLTFNNRGYLALSAAEPDAWNPDGAILCLTHTQSSLPRHRRLLTIRPTGQLEGNNEACPEQ